MTVTTVTTVGYREVHELSRAGQVFTVGVLLAASARSSTRSRSLMTLLVEGGLHGVPWSGGCIRMLDELNGSLHRLRIRPHRQHHCR